MEREGHYQKIGRRPLKVMVAMLLSEPSGQRKLAGVFAHLGANPDWDLKILRTQSEITAGTLRAAAADGLDGLILSVRYDKDLFSVLPRLKCPVVVMDNDPPELRRRKNLVVIRNDSREIARAAAKLFKDIGNFKSTAFVHDRMGADWSEMRAKAFAEETGGTVKNYAPSGKSAEEDLARLIGFLKGLDYPAALLAANDARAAEVIVAAAKAGVEVPQKLSVLGIDNDPYVCDIVTPGISSVEPDFFAEGKAAAELLDPMMRSRHAKRARRLAFGVKRVVLRSSTAYLPPAQNVISKAKDYIAAHATNGITPGDVAKHLGVSRPLLDLRFRQMQSQTVGELITQTKLAEVSRLLKATKTPIFSIPSLCGFRNANSLKNLFKRRFGASMRAFRNDA